MTTVPNAEVSEDFEARLTRVEEIRRSNPAEAVAAATEALAIAETDGNRSWLARILVMLGHINYSRGEYSSAREQFERALEIARPDGLRKPECEALLGIGFIDNSVGRCPEAAAALTEALAIARELGERCTQGFAHNALGNTLTAVGETTEAIGEFEQGLAIFIEEKEPNGEFFVRNGLGVLCLGIGDDQGALEQLTRALALAETLDNVQTRIVSRVNLGNVLERLGRIDEALEHYEQSLALCRTVSAPGEQSYVLISMGSAELTRRNGEAALSWFMQARALAASIGDAVQWTALGVSAYALEILGRYEEAITSLLEALAHTEVDADATYIPAYHEALARCYEALGDSAGALRHRRLETETRDRLAGIEQQRKIVQLRMREEMAAALAEHARLRREAEELEARVASTTGDLDDVESALERRDAFIATLRREIDEVATDLAGASASRVQAIGERLRHRLDDERSWQGFTAGFENVHPGFLRSLARRSPGLTRMEIKICVLMRLDLTTKEMSELLFTSPRTIHGHRFNIRRKLDLKRDDDLAEALGTLAITP
jgi:tetratricopeptide (TPR) repeat protein/DNA-binding CsgD family transcriptional regulator